MISTQALCAILLSVSSCSTEVSLQSYGALEQSAEPGIAVGVTRSITGNGGNLAIHELRDLFIPPSSVSNSGDINDCPVSTTTASLMGAPNGNPGAFCESDLSNLANAAQARIHGILKPLIKDWIAKLQSVYRSPLIVAHVLLNEAH